MTAARKNTAQAWNAAVRRWHVAAGANIRANRELQAMSQQDLAAALGISPSQLCRIETGAGCKDTRRGQIAAALGVTVSDLWDHAEFELFASLELDRAATVAGDQDLTPPHGITRPQVTS